ncbi:MAG: carboxylating nicotinate-nucleotide diphosphorylase [Pseudomonadota bacterium]
MDITKDIETLVDLAFEEDLGNIGDITTKSTIDPKKKITTNFISRDTGIVAGIPLARYCLKKQDQSLKITEYKSDGDKIKPKDIIMSVTGNAQNILQSERIALNFMTHLSGIATETSKYVEAICHTNAKILDTRKTLPGYRTLAKHAVKMGGGNNHRMGLFDMVLIKDNHIAAAGGVVPALEKVREATPDIKIEIEVDTLEQLEEVMLFYDIVDFVLLDNMSPQQLKEALEIIKGKILSEASGGVNMNTVVEIAESGVDYISIGALTHSVKVFDIGLDSVDN